MNTICRLALILPALLLAQPSLSAVSIQRVPGRCVGCKRPYQIDHIKFVTPIEGWATAVQIVLSGVHISQLTGVLHTSNAGKTWTPVAGVETYGVGIEPTFSFINAREGWIGWTTAGTPFNHLLRTMNGGRSWTKLGLDYLNDLGMFVDFRFFDSNLGYAVLSTPNGPQFGTTRDGGRIWRFRSEPRLAHVGRMLFLNPRVGWIGGSIVTDLDERPRLVRTVDGGGNWQEARFPPNVKGGPRDLFFLDPERGWLVLWNGFVGPKSPRFDPSTLLRTTDGGRTWSEELGWAPQGRTLYLYAVRYLSEKIGTLVVATATKDGAVGKDAFTVLATFDGGHTWNPHELPGPVGSCDVVAGEVWCNSGLDILRIHVQP